MILLNKIKQGNSVQSQQPGGTNLNRTNSKVLILHSSPFQHNCYCSLLQNVYHFCCEVPVFSQKHFTCLIATIQLPPQLFSFLLSFLQLKKKEKFFPDKAVVELSQGEGFRWTMECKSKEDIDQLEIPQELHLLLKIFL